MEVLQLPSALLLGNIAENWKVFRQKFEWYLATKGVEKKRCKSNI